MTHNLNINHSDYVKLICLIMAGFNSTKLIIAFKHFTPIVNNENDRFILKSMADKIITLVKKQKDIEYKHKPDGKIVLSIYDSKKKKFIFEESINVYKVQLIQNINKICKKDKKTPECNRFYFMWFSISNNESTLFKQSRFENVSSRKNKLKQKSKKKIALENRIIKNIGPNNNQKYEVNMDFIQNYLIGIIKDNLGRWNKELLRAQNTYSIILNKNNIQINVVKSVGWADKEKRYYYNLYNNLAHENMPHNSYIMKELNNLKLLVHESFEECSDPEMLRFKSNNQSKNKFYVDFKKYCTHVLFNNPHIKLDKFMLLFLEYYSRQNAPFKTIKQYWKCMDTIKRI